MARKVREITIKDGEHELSFRLTQMAATKKERWINRLLLLLAKSGKESFSMPVDITKVKSEDELKRSIYQAIKASGIAGVLKMVGSISYEEAEPLYDELLLCAERKMGDLYKPCTKDELDNCVENVGTLYTLRAEILTLNFDFFGQGEISPTPGDSRPAITIGKATPTSAE